MMTNRFAYAIVAIVATFLLIGCQTAQKSKSTETAQKSKSTESQAPSAKAESPSGTKTVKGINGWEGDITGTPAPGSRFKRLKIGMGMQQVTDLIGQPTDRGAYVTGKAWIPFYHGSDRHRYEMVYQGLGRLIFSSGGIGASGYYLTSIIHNAQEGGYR